MVFSSSLVLQLRFSTSHSIYPNHRAANSIINRAILFGIRSTCGLYTQQHSSFPILHTIFQASFTHVASTAIQNGVLYKDCIKPSHAPILLGTRVINRSCRRRNSSTQNKITTDNNTIIVATASMVSVVSCRIPDQINRGRVI